MRRPKKTHHIIGCWRLAMVRLIFVSVALLLGWRLFYLQVMNPDFLKKQGDHRHLKKVAIPTHRGVIFDRHGEPLAVSTPVHSVWANPQEINATKANISDLADVLGLSATALWTKIDKYKHRQFVYLKRRVNPNIAVKVAKLNLTGVNFKREYKRYYPAGEVTSHLIGFTNIDDHGQEGLELAYDHILTGVPGSKLMIRDRRGNYVGGGELLTVAKHGQNIQLSIDLRLQYLAYQALKKAVNNVNARAGSAVVLDVRTGEVLAIVNQPSFNPNNRQQLKPNHFRNRAVTDLFEPGSTVKPFTVASALTSGRFTPATVVDTHPGVLQVDDHTVKDFRNYGKIDVATVIQKSSNVATSKIALAIRPEQLWRGFTAFGVAEQTGAYFPGEATGHLPDPQTWKKLDRAILAYGYGVSMSALQLARSYMVLANGGILQPVSFIKQNKALFGQRVLTPNVTEQVLKMMERVVQPGGTAQMAAVENYTVAGKTGTVKQAIKGGYANDQYVSLFAGVIPARQPRLAMVVMVDNPKGDDYYGGVVAAPIFAEVMTGAMRLLNIAPDNLLDTQLVVMQK